LSSPRLVVISGPSGCGKTTLIAELLRDGGVRRGVTATTRRPRPGEQDGVSYHFYTRPRFLALRDAGELLEWAEVHGQLYGTPRSEIAGRPEDVVILDLDVQGFRTLRGSGLAMIGIFIAPPSLGALRNRLLGRGTEGPEQIAVRLNNALHELEAQGDYDHVIVNHDVEESLKVLRRLLGRVPAAATAEDAVPKPRAP
jgi:guanylate kinase